MTAPPARKPGGWGAASGADGARAVPPLSNGLFIHPYFNTSGMTAPRHDPFVDSPGDLTLSRVDVVEEHLEGRDPLHDAGLDDIPLVGGDDSWDGVERKRSLLARMVKGHPLVEVSPGQGVCALLE